MEDKTKFIIMALLGIILVIGFLCLQIYGSKQALVSERDALKQDKISLSKRIEDVLKDSKSLQDRVSALNADLDRVSKEKSEIQNKLGFLTKEKQDLENKLRSLPKPAMAASPAVTGQQIQVTPPGSQEAYWAQVLKAKMDLELQLESIRTQLRALQINNEQLQKDKTVLDLEAKNLAREKQNLERQYAYNQKRNQEIVDKLAQELVMEKNDKFQIEESVKSIKNENDILKRQLKAQGSRKTNLETQLAELQKEKGDFENKLGVMDSVLKDNIMQIDNFKRQLESTQKDRFAAVNKKETVELAPIVVRPKQETQSPASMSLASKGKIVSVNTDNNFVIIDLGEDSGIRMGDTFQVYRQNKAIATIEVIQVRPDISACDIKKQTAAIEAGDTVK